MKSFFLSTCLGLALLISTIALATPEEELELKELDVVQEKLSLQKEWANYRFEVANKECYSKFFTNSCLQKSKTIHDQELKQIRIQEVPMHDRQRAIKESLKNQRDKLRAEERLDPKKSEERAKNKSIYEEKQIDRAQREKDLEERRQDSQRRSQENRTASPF